MTGVPIIFSAQMVRAILDGRKTMTRRLAWRENGKPSPWQKIKPGDLLWVRESWRSKCGETNHQCCVIYRATDDDLLRDTLSGGGRFTPSIHMPRWASRITLEVTATKIERLNDISDGDAKAEGVDKKFLTAVSVNGVGDDAKIPYSYIGGFACIWLDLHGTGSWAANPEVVAILFNVHHRNIDSFKGDA